MACQKHDLGASGGHSSEALKNAFGATLIISFYKENRALTKMVSTFGKSAVSEKACFGGDTHALYMGRRILAMMVSSALYNTSYLFI